MSDARVDLRRFVALGIDAQAANQWVQAGVTDPHDAARWTFAKETPTTFRAWVDAGFDAGHALTWRQFGHDAASAAAERDAGRAPGEGTTHGALPTFAAARRAQRPFDLIRLEAAASGDPDPDEDDVKLFLQRVSARLQTPEALQRFIGAALSYAAVPWLDDDAVLWAEVGMPALDALDWRALGLTALEAVAQAQRGESPATIALAWWSAGVPQSEVAAWLGAGLSAADAAEQRAKGVTVEQAAVLKSLRRPEA